MSRVMRYILIPEYDVSQAMLDEENVSPFDKSDANAWINLRRFDDSGVIKSVVKFDVCCGTPTKVAEYINANAPTVYETAEDLLAVIEV